MKLLYFSVLILTFQFCKAQDIKPLDYASLYLKNKVKTRECYEIRYKGNNSSDSIHIGSETFNHLGQLISYTEYYSKGEKMAEYHYEYDSKNKLVKNTIRLVFNNWQETEFKLTFDAKGKLIKRELPQAVPSFWTSETYHYNTAGILVKSEQFYTIEGEQKSMAHKDYPPSLQPKENSLSYIYDPKGLLILHQVYQNGKVNKAYKFDYTHF